MTRVLDFDSRAAVAGSVKSLWCWCMGMARMVLIC